MQSHQHLKNALQTNQAKTASELKCKRNSYSLGARQVTEWRSCAH